MPLLPGMMTTRSVFTVSGMENPTRPTRPDRPTRSSSSSRSESHTLWPYRVSSLFVCLCSVLGMYNISRFSMLVYVYKGGFILEFIILSFLFGFPFLYLLMTLGQYLGPGILNMWHISPAFKGVGIAFIYIYTMYGIYSSVPIAWLLVYLRDSFVSSSDSLRWRKCHPFFGTQNCLEARNSSSLSYYSWTASSYFNGRVLGRDPDSLSFGGIKLDLAFNLYIVWGIVFLTICKGTKSLGKVISIIGALPIFILMMVLMRIIEQWHDSIVEIFQSPFDLLLSDSNSWMVASREVFLTWCVFGLVVFHHSGHNKASDSVTKLLLFVSTVGTLLLVIASLFVVCTINTLLKRSLAVVPSSYETESSVNFMQPSRSALLPSYNFTVINFFLGESFLDDVSKFSGYQVLRFATEIFPASLAMEGIESNTSFWSICFYAMMIMFGLSQLIVIWSCVVESLMVIKIERLKAGRSIFCFLSCHVAFLLSLPFTSNIGIFLLFFFDYLYGSFWWIMIPYLLLLVAVLFVTGRNYGTDKLIERLHPLGAKSWLYPFLTIMWNLVLPVAFMILFISFLKAEQFDPLSIHKTGSNRYDFWSLKQKTVGVLIQVVPLFLVAVISLYEGGSTRQSRSSATVSDCFEQCCCPLSSSSPEAPVPSDPFSFRTNPILDDPPPKYTPPPSYSTATSRQYIKLLRSSSLLLPPAYSELSATKPSTSPSSSSS